MVCFEKAMFSQSNCTTVLVPKMGMKNKND